MASMKIIFFVICSIVISIAAKKKIEVHFESLCPGCQEFITTSFTKFSQAEQHELLADVVFYPYGNAYQKFDGKLWQFTCQHGTNECVGNLVETCAVKKFDTEVAYIFLSCLESNLSHYANDFTKTSNWCLTNYPTQKTDLWNCVQSTEGNTLQHEIASYTEGLRPIHKWVPWIIVDGVHDSIVENAVLDDMLSYLCQDQTNIAACVGVKENKFLFEKNDNKCYIN